MALESVITRKAYTGNGVNDTFAGTNIKIVDSSHAEVYVAGVLQTEDTHYTVSDVGEDTGFIVTFEAAYIPASDAQVLLIRVPPLKQQTRYPANSAFPEDDHEDALDYQTMISQYLRELLNRALKLAVTSAYTDIEVPDPEDGKLLRWKSDLSGLENFDIAGISALAVSDFMKTVLDDETTTELLSSIGVSDFMQTVLDDEATTELLSSIGVSDFMQTVLDDESTAAVQATLGIASFDKEVVETNMLLLALKVAVIGSLVKYGMVDAIADAFVDESGVDTGASEYVTYDGGSDLYESDTGTETWAETLNADNTVWANGTIRQVLSAADISTSGSAIRITVQASTSAGFEVDNFAIVERDSVANGTTIPTEILFDGTSGLILAAGESATSDWLTYALDETKDYLLIADLAADVGARVLIGTGLIYYKAASDSYNTQNLTADGNQSNTYLFSSVEIFAGSMSLQSETSDADAQPDTIRMVMIAGNTAGYTINTDYKGWVSRDAGTTWTQVTLADEGDYSSDAKVLEGEADVSGQPAGTSIKWKVTSDKDIDVRGIGLLWE